MQTVRFLEVKDATSGTWPALDELMAYHLDRSEFQPTCARIYWKPHHWSFELGVYQDGDELDTPLLEPDHFVFPVLRAAERLQSPTDYIVALNPASVA